MTEQTFVIKVYSADMLVDSIRSQVMSLCHDLDRYHSQIEVLSLEVSQDGSDYRPLL